MKFAAATLLLLGFVQAAAAFNVEVRFTSSASSAVRSAFSRAANRWGQVISTNIADYRFPSARDFNCNGQTVSFRAGEVLDDLVIAAQITAIDGVGSILGSAGPCVSDSSDYTRVGAMNFDSADMANMQQQGNLGAVILHEMGHVIGIGTKWTSLNSNYEYTGAGGARGLRAIGGSGRPLIENTGGSGTRGGHWRESTYGDELMTGYVGRTRNPFSALTVESLTDLGYSVRSNQADPFTIPRTVPARGPGDLEFGDDIMHFESTYLLGDNGEVTEVKSTDAPAADNGPMFLGIGGVVGLAVAGLAFVVYRRRTQVVAENRISVAQSRSVTGPPTLEL